MSQYSLHSDRDQDSLFGSPPPSPVRGRSPSQGTFIAGEEVPPTIAAPSTGVGRKNVGTIALPGSHMSCAELPANLLASSLSLPRTSSHDSQSIAPYSTSGTPPSSHTRIAASQSSTRSIPSRTSSAASTVSPTSIPTGKRRMPKAKSLASASPTPPITLPGPNEPTPPNFLRSQSSLLGLAGLVGCVKPTRLYTHGPQPPPAQSSCSRSPVRGLSPAHPIILDDDQEAPHTVKHPLNQLQIPRRPDQLDPEALRSNIMNSLAKEKNIFPVLESLIKLFGAEPHLPPLTPPSQPFARPYSHGVAGAQTPISVVSPAPDSSATSAPCLKRRKLRHVPAGAVDWDVPFPFAAGEGPEAYRDTWARDRAKQLVTQLLELVQNAAKRAALKTTKNGIKVYEGRTRVQKRQSSRSVSVETQTGQTIGSLAQTTTHQSRLYADASPEDASAAAGRPNDLTLMVSLGHHLSTLEMSSTVSLPAAGSKDKMTTDSAGVVEEGESDVPCDYAAFEEWLSQLQQFAPPEASTSMSESDWGTPPSVSLDPASSSPTPNILIPMQCDSSTSTHAILDEAIDPALLAISQQTTSVPQSQSPTSSSTMLASGDFPQVLDVSLTPPVLIHSPRTSLSSLTEPLTPLSEVFVDVPTSTIVDQDLVHGFPVRQSAEKDPDPRVANRVSSPSLTESSESPRITAAQKGKAHVDDSAALNLSSASTRFAPSAISASKSALDKQTILERAQERRGQLVAEIERAKMETWEMSIENAVLVHLARSL